MRGTAYKPQLKVQFTPDSQSAVNQAYYFLGGRAGGLCGIAITITGK